MNFGMVPDAERAMVHNTVQPVMLDVFLLMPDHGIEGVFKADFNALDRGLTLAPPARAHPAAKT